MSSTSLNSGTSTSIVRGERDSISTTGAEGLVATTTAEEELLLQQAEEQDFQKSMELLEKAKAIIEVEENEQKDVCQSMEILADALSAMDLQFLQEKAQLNSKYVHFSHSIVVHHLPQSEEKEASRARRSIYSAGPLHDELWDGFTQTFRDIEITPEEVAALLRRKTLVSFRLKKLFGSRVVKIDGESHARKVIAQEDDEEPREMTSPRTSMNKKGKRPSQLVTSVVNFVRRKSSKEKLLEEEDRQIQLSGDEWLRQVLEESERLALEEEAAEVAQGVSLAT